jgi:peptidoglycan/LPS O-acetylase OafA/YrhL
VQFYVIFPLIACCMLRKPLLTTICAMLLASGTRVYASIHPWMDAWMSIHSLPAQIDVFVTGMLGAYLFRMLSTRRTALIHPRWAWAWTLLAVCGTALYFKVSYDTVYEPDPYMRVAWFERHELPLLEIAFLSVTLGSLFGIACWRRLVANPAFGFYAQISYNFYLWHMVVCSELQNHNIMNPWDPNKHPLFTAFNLLCSSALASLLTFGIERPLMRLRWKKRDSATARAPMPQ